MRRHTGRLLLLRGWLVLAVLALAVLALRPASAQESPPPADLTITATPAYEGSYMPGTWLPLEAVLTNDGPAREGLLVASVPNSPVRYTLPVALPGGARQTHTLLLPIDTNTSEVRLAFEQGGETRVATTLDVRPRTGERLLALAADPPLRVDVPLRQDMERLPFVPVAYDIAALPVRPMGLRSLSLLLLAQPTADVLSPAQQQALLAWVAGGGHLILAGGPEAARFVAGLPDALRPAAIGPARRLDAAPLAALARDVRAGLPPRPDDAPRLVPPADLDGVALTPRLPSALAVGAPDEPAWVTLPLGLGRVTQLAFGPTDDALQAWDATPRFWDAFLQPALLVDGPFGPQSNIDALQEQQLTEAVGNVPALPLPTATPLLLLLLLYVLLVGPLVAWLLHRLDRQVWGWLVLPGLALLFGLLGGGLALALRADERLVSQVTLVEQTSAQQARVRTLLAVLSPYTTTLDLALPPTALARPLRSVSGRFAPIGGTTGSFAQQAETLPLEVPGWNLSGILAEQSIDLPALEAQLVLDGTGLRAEVRNTTGLPLRDVTMAFQAQVLNLGNLAPGDTASVPWPYDSNSEVPPLGTPLSPRVVPLGPDETQQDPDRRRLARAALAQAVQPNAGGQPRPLVLAWLDASPLPLAVDAPGAATQQTTLLVSPVRLVGSGAVELPPRWLALDLRGTASACFSGGSVQGVPATDPLLLTLRLPPDLRAFEATTLRLALGSERGWPNTGLRTELFDWQRGRWIDTNFDGPGTLEIDRADAAQAFLQDGTLRLRLRGTIDQAGCVFVQGQATGALP